MKVISVYNNKGGVGKTTTTKRLVKSLEKDNKRILIIDLDPQGNISSQFINGSKIKKSVYEVLLDTCNTNEGIYSTEGVGNVDILPAKLNLQTANNEIMLKSMQGKNPAVFLKNKLNEIDCEYDYIIIDCPPTIDLLVTNGLTVTDEVIIPITVDNYSLDGISMLLEKINQVKIDNNDNLVIKGIFLNRFKRSKIHSEMLSTLREFLGDLVIDVPIGDYSIINENSFTNDEEKLKKHKVNVQFEELFNQLGV